MQAICIMVLGDLGGGEAHPAEFYCLGAKFVNPLDRYKPFFWWQGKFIFCRKLFSSLGLAGIFPF